MAGEERAECLAVETWIVEVEPAQREHRFAHPGPLAPIEVPVTSERARQMSRCRQSIAPDPGNLCLAAPGVGAQDRDRQPALERGAVLRSEPAEESPVGSAATQEDMLAVVEYEAVALERPRGTPETRPPFEQRHLMAGVGTGDRRRQSGQPAPDNDDMSRVRTHVADAPVRLRTATQAFSRAGRLTRWSSAASGSRSMRSSNR